jgi:hypothetical protein
MIPYRTALRGPLAVGILAFTLLTLPGCGQRVVTSQSNLTDVQHHPIRVAVMPIRNQTGKPLTAPPSHAYLKSLFEAALASRPQDANNVPLSFRRKINRTLYKKAYRVVPLEIVDTRVGAQQSQDILELPAAEARAMLGADSLLTSTITRWHTQKLKTDNTIMVAASFALVDLDTKRILWEAEWPYGPVSILASQPWHDVRYYISRVVDAVFATLPSH